MRDPSLAAALAAAHRTHWGPVLAATAAVTRDLDLAEDAVQEAFAQAVTAWAEQGVPDAPGGWLTVAARRRAQDAMRRAETGRRALPQLIWEAEHPEEGTPEADPKSTGRRVDRQIADEADPVVRDEQLRLIFLAAHPALAPESRIALTLRLVAGLPTERIAAAFHVPTPTMAARLTRAKKRIALSRIPCRVPEAAELPARTVDVLDTASVLLSRPDDAVHDAAQHLLEVLAELLPGSTEPAGLLAQTLLLRARAVTRRDERGRPVALSDQDRSRWDRTLIARADALVLDALAAGGRGPYLLQGAIAAAVAVPDRHEDVDWEEVVALYDALLAHWPTAIVRLGRGVALAEARGARAGLEELDPLVGELGDHRRIHVIRGELLRRLGRHEEAAGAYREALARPGEAVEEDLLQDLMTSLADS